MRPHTHTPAPWKVEIGKEFSGDNWLIATLGAAQHDEGIVEVYVTTDRIRVSEMDGDAIGDGYLIAAAPDLLATLEAILLMCGSDDAHIHSAAHAAIAKARGES